VKLTIFYADKGDCLLLTSKNKRSILCDGGIPSAFRDAVAPLLRARLPAGGALDVVYVSHIDEDHIGGVLGLLDNAFDWKVFHLHKQAGDTTFKAPTSPEPPAIKNLWHNAFHDLVPDNVGEIRDMLAANALALRLVNAGWARYAGAVSANLANSIPQALRVSRRAGTSQLNIPLNKPAAGRLMLVRTNGAAHKVGTMRLTTIGPAEADLEKLRDDWNTWLDDQKNAAALLKFRKETAEDEARLETAFPPADALRLLAAAKVLGDRKKVTPPNLASLMFLVEEDGRTILLTGDGHSDDVEAGLKRMGKLPDGAGLHVDVLKVPHHGSEHNTTPGFPKRVTADHYVFCGNGFSENPDVDVVKRYLSSRLGKPRERSPNPQTGQPFHFWFSATSGLVPPKLKPHMRKVEKIVQQAAQASGGRLKVHGLKNEPLELNLA
jgi:hypothetical protein